MIKVVINHTGLDENGEPTNEKLLVETFNECNVRVESFLLKPMEARTIAVHKGLSFVVGMKYDNSGPHPKPKELTDA